MSRLHRRMAAAAIVTLLLSACSGSGSDGESSGSESDSTDVAVSEPADTAAGTAPTDTETPTTDGNDTVDAGRCAVIIGDSEGPSEYESVDCGEPHDAEFAGSVDAPAGTEPVALMAACASTVEGLTGRPVEEFGLDVGSATTEDGELECWAEASAPGTLSASILDDGLDAAIQGFVFVTDLADGTCFRLADPDAFDLATVAECEGTEVEMIHGQFEADDGPIPDDAAIDDFFARCDEFETAADFDVIGNSRYLISPLDDSWEALGRRTVLCISWTDPAVGPAEDPVDADPADAIGPVCGVYEEDLGAYPEVPCDEPHTAEYAGSVTPPDGNLPDDAGEAGLLLRQLCRESVETLTGRDLSQFGTGVGFVSIDGLGEPMVNDIRCYASVEAEGSLVGAISEIGYDAALQFDVIADQAPGTCFLFVDDETFDVGEVVACDTPDALMVVGSFEVDAPAGAPHPGDDALRELRAERCGDIVATSGLAVDPATVSGTFPGEKTWTAFDRRTVTCDATPT